MREWLAVASGGAIGSLLRWQIGCRLASRATCWPLGTWTVNVGGSLLVGLLVALGITDPRTPLWRLLLVTGFAGGFTTWSAFNQEVLEMMRSGQAPRATLYVAATLAGGLAGGLLGTWIGGALGRARGA